MEFMVGTYTTEEERGTVMSGERVLYGAQNTEVEDVMMYGGESAVKECRNVTLKDVTFGWKYPLWYSRDITMTDSIWTSYARAGGWYVDNLVIKNTPIKAPKCIRKCNGVVLENVEFPEGEETLWNCTGVDLKNVTVKGDYFGMGCSNVKVDGLKLVGHYTFDSCHDMELRNVDIDSRDTFWNCENITVYDSHIKGEYMGWNSKNLTFINCTLESLQGFCYIDNLKMVDCKLQDSPYSFEFCTNMDVHAEGKCDIVLNPGSGVLELTEIGQLIQDPDRVNAADLTVLCDHIGERLDKVVYDENPYGFE